MIKFKHVHIWGFKNPELEVRLDFSQNNTSILHGQNGSGKTTFLRILFALLSHDSQILKDENVRRIELVFKDLSKKGANSVAKLNMLNDFEPDLFKNDHTIFKNIDIKYNWEQFDSKFPYQLKSVFLGIDRGVPIQTEKISSDMIYEYFRHPRYRSVLRDLGVKTDYSSLKELSKSLTSFINLRNRRMRRRNRINDEILLTKNNIMLNRINVDDIEYLIIDRYLEARYATTQRIQEALFQTFAIAIEKDPKLVEKLPKDFDGIIDESRDRLIEALEESPDNAFTRKLKRILQDKDYLALEQDDSNLVKTLLYKMITELDKEKQLIQSINVLIDTFNSHMSDNKKLVIKNRSLEVSINEDNHPLSKLSSGERHLLTFLVTVLVLGENRDFLIVDEPEISLNTLWQRTLLPLMEKLVPNTQIIVATHSPSIAKYNLSNLVDLRR